MRTLLGVMGWLWCTLPALAQSTWQFTDVTAAAGLTYAHGFRAQTEIGTGEVQLGGASAGDFDRDGDLDLYVVRGDAGADLLLRNRGDGTFEDVAPAAGVAVMGQVNAGATFADVDGDGWLDLFTYGLVCKPKIAYCDIGEAQRSPPRLFRNRGDGAFEDVTARSGIAITSDAFSASFGDYDRDGDLDLFLTHWVADGYRPLGSSEHLWRNNGDLTFTDVTEASGINTSYVYSEGVGVLSFTGNFADIDSDGWPDILVAGDFKTSKVFRNNGNGTFTDTTAPVISDENGMGAAVGDYDNDGDLDWFISSIWDPNQIPEGNWFVSGNRLYNNRGDGTFDDVTTAAGVRNGYWGWGSTFADLDNDGWLDLFHLNGWRFDAPEAFEFHFDPSRLFVATGQMTFSERAIELGIVDTGQGRGVVAFDYDRDGDVDLFVANNQQPPRLFRNDGGNANRFLTVTLRGTAPNTEAIGARVYAFAGGRMQMRELRAGNNFLSQDPVEAHFGLGATAMIDEVGVVWPDGQASIRRNLAPDQRLVLDQPHAIDCRGDAHRSSCRAGGGRDKRTDCMLELLTYPAPETAANGTTSNRMTCTNGRPTCDTDGDATDGACSVRVRLCINNHDPRRPWCVPSDVATVEVLQPRRGRDAASDLLIEAIEHGAGDGLGLSIARRRRVVRPGRASAETDHCSAPVVLRVPLGGRTVRMFATDSNGRRDADSLTLECRAP